MKAVLHEEYREHDHWFFRARRAIFARLLAERVRLSPRAPILEVGPGSGVNVPVLAPHGRLVVLDASPVSLADCATHGARALVRGDAVRLPFAGESFELVCLFDVLEHLADDEAALAEVRRVLRPGGTLLLSVPALPLLWGRQDVLSEHHRRYLRGPLSALLSRAGFQVAHLTYFNTLLFPLVLGVRLALRPFLARATRGGSDFSVPAPLGLGEVLYRVFAAEGGWVARRRLPIGVSLLCVARPAAGDRRP